MAEAKGRRTKSRNGTAKEADLMAASDPVRPSRGGADTDQDDDTTFDRTDQIGGTWQSPRAPKRTRDPGFTVEAVPPSVAESKNAGLRLHPSTNTFLRTLATRHGINVSDIIRTCISEGLTSRGHPSITELGGMTIDEVIVAAIKADDH